MLSASDIDTYRICPLKYKFARVFRIPQEPTIHQRFGIVAAPGARALPLGRRRRARRPDGAVRGLLAALRLRRLGRRAPVPRARGGALERYWRSEREAEAEPVWFERSFAFRLGPHLLRGRVDRVDRRPDGTLRADRLQDRQGEDRERAARGRAALALPDGRARVVAARDLGAELLLRADRREGAGRALRGGARPRRGDGRRRSPTASWPRTSSRRPRPRSARSATTGSSARRPRSRPGARALRSSRPRGSRRAVDRSVAESTDTACPPRAGSAAVWMSARDAR